MSVKRYFIHSLLAVMVSGSLSAQVVLLQEMFNSEPLTGNQPVSVLTPNNWYGHAGVGTKLADYDNIHQTSGIDNQNWYMNAAATFLFYRPADTAQRNHTLAWSDSVSIDLSQFTDIEIKFSLSNSALHTTRIALQVDGDWYATETAFTYVRPSAGVWGEQIFDFTADAAAWRGITFDGTADGHGTELTLSGTTLGSDLPLGEVTAVGFFFERNGVPENTMRLDDFSITGTPIPEPSTYALLGGLIALGGVMLQRRHD